MSVVRVRFTFKSNRNVRCPAFWLAGWNKRTNQSAELALISITLLNLYIGYCILMGCSKIVDTFIECRYHYNIHIKFNCKDKKHHYNQQMLCKYTQTLKRQRGRKERRYKQAHIKPVYTSPKLRLSQTNKFYTWYGGIKFRFLIQSGCKSSVRWLSAFPSH